MIKSDTYRILLETKLIEKFKEEFYEKIGYYPTVITKTNLTDKTAIGTRNLEQLKDCFDPFLPNKYNKKLTLESKCRIREIVELRHIYSYLAKQMGYSLKEIAKSLNNRDHTTIISSIRMFNNLYETNEPFRHKYITIINHIKSIDNESSVMESSDTI